MNVLKNKRVGSVFLLIVGAAALISELFSLQKNYYMQSLGIVCLMMGLYFINTSVVSKFEKKDASVDISPENDDREEEEEEEEEVI